MRLLQVSVRSLLLYSIILLLVSIPIVLVSIKTILNQEADELIALQSEQFIRHIKGFEYLGDLETDLTVLDKLSNNIHIKPAGDARIDQAYQNVSIYDSLEGEVRPFRQLVSPVTIKNKSYILTVRMSLVDNEELVLVIGTVQVVLSIILTAGLLLLNRSLSKKLWRPFYRTLDQLKAYELDKTESVVIEKSNIIEFDDLNKTVRHLTERNRRVFLQQKEFIENASHELQTPIAIFQSKLDTLMQSPGLSQTDAETMMELEQTAQRMARLNKNLLLLSKIDNEQFVDIEDVEVSAIINSQVAILRQMARSESIQITMQMDTLLLSANRTLVEILITNLLHNAIRHSAKSEQINITLHDRQFSVTNKGVPLKMDIDQMTQRFSKESADTNSTGLGLAIVRKICDTCSYGLRYTYQNNAHTFTVTF